MKKAIPFHPPLFAAFPVLSLYSANLALIPVSDIWRPLGQIVAASLAVWALAAVVLRDNGRAAVVATVIAMSTLMYSRLTGWISFGYESHLPLYLWLAATTAAAGLAAWKIRSVAALNFIGSVLVATSVGAILLGRARMAVDLAQIRQTAIRQGTTVGRTPDVFYIILDGYGRADALKRAMGFDNSGFVRELERRGLYVATRSHSNYSQTELSIGSSLNLNFIPDLLPSLSTDTSDRLPLDALVSRSQVSAAFRARGYQTVALTTGFPAFEGIHADVALSPVGVQTLFEGTLFDQTPFAKSFGGINSRYQERREMLQGGFRRLNQLAQPAGRPKFVFAHILAPHPPFVFKADGSAAPKFGAWGFWDGSDYRTYVGGPAEYRRGYVDQIQWLNRQVLATIDRLKAVGDHPVIIIQGDHGSKLGLDQYSLAKTDIHECFPNLAAFDVPPSIRSNLYPEITPVNEFRLVLSGLFGDSLPTLPDRSWYSPFNTPYRFTEVTQALQKLPGKLPQWQKAPK